MSQALKPECHRKGFDFKLFTMKNKLKLNSTSKDASCSSLSQSRTTEVITVVSDRGSSADETDLASHPSKDTHGSDVAAANFTTRRVNPTKERPRDFCARDVKIAYIFLRTTKHNTNGRMGQREMAFPSQIEKVQQVKSQTERKDHCRGQLPVPGLLSFLEEIQTSNPAFPARTVFNNLQKKTSEQDSGDTLQ